MMLNNLKQFIKKDIKKLDLCITHKCNLTCGTCNIWQIYRDDKELMQKETSLEAYKDFFDKYNYWNRISFTGGEPFLRKDLKDIIISAIELCKDLDVVSINSNGFLVNEVLDTANALLKKQRLKGLFFSISLDGVEDLHDKNRGIVGAYRRATETFNRLKEIKDNRLSIHYEYTISKNNIGNLKRLFEDEGFDPNDFIITFAQTSRRYDNIGMECAVDDSALREEVRYFLSKLRIRDLESLGQWTFLTYFLKGLKVRCVAGINTFHMDPYGNIYLCTLLNERIGSIKEGIKEGKIPDGCYCYTPCESYFGLLMEGPVALPKAFWGVGRKSNRIISK